MAIDMFFAVGILI